MSEKWTVGGNGTVIFTSAPSGQYRACINGHTPQMAKRIVVAVNNHGRLVEVLGVALDAIGEAMNAGITMGGISPETFQSGRALLADIEKESHA